MRLSATRGEVTSPNSDIAEMKAGSETWWPCWPLLAAPPSLTNWMLAAAQRGLMPPPDEGIWAKVLFALLSAWFRKRCITMCTLRRVSLTPHQRLAKL